jgi:hypothetical protein
MAIPSATRWLGGLRKQAPILPRQDIATTIVRSTATWEISHSTQFSGEARYCSSKSPGGEDLEIQEPILRGDCAAFHFHPTLTSMLGSTLIRDQVVEVR